MVSVDIDMKSKSVYAVGVPLVATFQYWTGSLDAGFGTHAATDGVAFLFLRIFATLVSSFAFVYFVMFFFKKDVPRDTHISKLKIFEPAPWILGSLAVLCSMQCVSWLQTGNHPKHAHYNDWKRFGENPLARFGDFIVLSGYIFSIFCINRMIKKKQIVLFIIGTWSSFVHPVHMFFLYLTHKVLVPFNGNAEAVELHRETVMVFFYFYAVPIMGLLNASYFKVDFGFYSIRKVEQIPFCRIVCYQLGVWVFFFAITYVMSGIFGPADKASMLEEIGYNGDTFATTAVDWGMFVGIFAVARLSGSYSYWRCFGICGLSHMRYLLTEQTALAYGRRTVNMQYSYGSLLITTYTVMTLGDMIGFFVSKCLCAGGMKDGSETAEATPSLTSYKCYFLPLLPAFFIFAYDYPVNGHVAGYYFSLAEAFWYVFGAAVPAYHLWSYGVLRSFDIASIQEKLGMHQHDLETDLPVVAVLEQSTMGKLVEQVCDKIESCIYKCPVGSSEAVQPEPVEERMRLRDTGEATPPGKAHVVSKVVAGVSCIGLCFLALSLWIVSWNSQKGTSWKVW